VTHYILRNQIVSYISPNRLPGLCKLDIFRRYEKTVVVMTEVADNTGQSVTNASEVIAMSIMNTFRLNPDLTMFVEHYGPESFDGNLDREDTYTVVTYDVAELKPGEYDLSRPSWHNAKRKDNAPEAVEYAFSLIGDPIVGITVGRAHILNPDGTDTSIEFTEEPTLEWLQEQVQGHIEITWCGFNNLRSMMVVNDEGLLINMKPNPKASILAGQPIVGPAVVLEGFMLR